ncbi:MAG: hypothetical protein ACK5AB_03940 [Bacteroidota bacterium]|jgi:hypothetical protein
MSQTKYKWMIFLVTILLVSNVVLAFFLFSSEKKQEQRKSKDDFAMAFYKEIGLSATQIDTFKVLKDQYFKEMRPIWGEIRGLKDSLYRNMGRLSKDSSASDLILLINQKNTTADSKTFDHFIVLRNKLDSGAQIKFDTSIARMMNRPWGSRNRK